MRLPFSASHMRNRPWTARVTAATAMFPWLGRICGMARTPLVSREGSLSAACAEVLCKVAHVPAAACRFAAQGLWTVLRTRAFVARLLLALQIAAFWVRLQALSAIRSTYHRQGRACETCVSIAYSWDETKQLLRDPPKTARTRQANQKIGRNVLVQRCLCSFFVRVRSQDEHVTEAWRSEEVIVPPVELHGKNTGFLAAGLDRAAPLPLFDRNAMQRMVAAVSCLILGFCGDSASTNRRLMKHVLGTAEDDGWSDRILVDPNQICLLHQIHRIKVQLIDIHRVVSLMFCLSKLVRAGSVVPVVANHIVQYVERSLLEISLGTFGGGSWAVTNDGRVRPLTMTRECHQLGRHHCSKLGCLGRVSESLHVLAAYLMCHMFFHGAERCCLEPCTLCGPQQ